MFKKIVVSTLIFIILMSHTTSLLAKIGDNKYKPKTPEQQKEQQKDLEKEKKKQEESFSRQIYANCETKDGKVKKGNVKEGGVLQYNIDCAPFHKDEILDITGKSKWSIVSWINRIITFFYQMALVAAVLGVLVAGVKYIKAGGEGGFAAAKDALKFALIGFLVAGTAWTLLTMWSRAMSMLA